MNLIHTFNQQELVSFPVLYDYWILIILNSGLFSAFSQ